ncbi:MULTISPECIES: hypothetical protein [Aeromonas]|uniref:hypothetical protein n=1 Tax=Aeromonas TaxID=642 RepID=UPI0009550D91|nr:hypothetical protein [Aeromonas veronii]SIQ83228.1 hypothetical protein SAMN05892873_11745 [Aeromonas veronii]
MAKTAMGSKRLIETSVVAWMDLLGYGRMLRDVKFDPSLLKARVAVQRLNVFQECISKHANKLMPSVVINDGVVLFRDLSPRTGRVTYDFINSVWMLHNAINDIEHQSQHPGVRTVVAAGFRVRRPTNFFESSKKDIGDNLIKRVEQGDISIQHAIYSALTLRSSYDVTPELQANFAFTKAYLAESSGTAGGFSGPNMFIDINILESSKVEWLDLEKPFGWETDGMQGLFAKINKIDDRLARKKQFLGALDAFQVAEKITADESVSKRLRRLVLKGSNR